MANGRQTQHPSIYNPADQTPARARAGQDLRSHRCRNPPKARSHQPPQALLALGARAPVQAARGSTGRSSASAIRRRVWPPPHRVRPSRWSLVPRQRPPQPRDVLRNRRRVLTIPSSPTGRRDRQCHLPTTSLVQDQSPLPLLLLPNGGTPRPWATLWERRRVALLLILSHSASAHSVSAHDAAPPRTWFDDGTLQYRHSSSCTDQPHALGTRFGNDAGPPCCRFLPLSASTYDATPPRIWFADERHQYRHSSFCADQRDALGTRFGNDGGRCYYLHSQYHESLLLWRSKSCGDASSPSSRINGLHAGESRFSSERGLLVGRAS